MSDNDLRAPVEAEAQEEEPYEFEPPPLVKVGYWTTAIIGIACLVWNLFAARRAAPETPE